MSEKSGILSKDEGERARKSVVGSLGTLMAGPLESMPDTNLEPLASL